MKANFSEIICIIDRSGSMHSIKSDAIGGFNTFLEEQKKLPSEATLSLVLFDNEYILVHDCQPLPEVVSLNETSYQPRGSTALLDAIGKTIDDVGARLAKTPEPERPSKIIVAILTDGLENASRKYSHEKVASMIKHQQEAYKWEFFFLGANMDAVNVASSMNIDADRAVQFEATAAGTQVAYQNMSRFVGKSRGKT